MTGTKRAVLSTPNNRLVLDAALLQAKRAEERHEELQAKLDQLTSAVERLVALASAGQDKGRR